MLHCPDPIASLLAAVLHVIIIDMHEYYMYMLNK